jgi:hypothetical protein
MQQSKYLILLFWCCNTWNCRTKFRTILFCSFLKTLSDVCFFKKKFCRLFIEKASSADKTFIPLEGAYHEAMFEESGPAIVQGMVDWILARSNSAGGGEDYSSAAKM